MCTGTMMLRGYIVSLLALAASNYIGVTGQFCNEAVEIVEDYVQQKNHDATNVIYFSDGSNFDDEDTYYVADALTRGIIAYSLAILFRWQAWASKHFILTTSKVGLQILIKSPAVKLKGIYIQDNAWAHRGPTYQNFYNTMYLHGVTDVSIISGSPYALEEEEAAEDTDRNPETDYRTVIPPENLLWTDTLWGLNVFLPQSSNYFDPLTDSYDDNTSVPLLAEMVESLGDNETVTFLSVGTLTPIAKMFDILSTETLESVLSKVDSLVVMGGAVNVSGNLFTIPNNADAEFNIYNDPHAAQEAFVGFSQHGVPITMVGLDATDDVSLSEELFDALTETPGNPEAAFTGALLERVRSTWFDPDLFFETNFLWDPTATILMFDRSAIKEGGSRTIPLKVITDQGVYGDEQGATRECTAEEAEDDTLCAMVEVVTDVDGDAINTILLEILQSRVNSAVVPLAYPGQGHARGNRDKDSCDTVISCGPSGKLCKRDKSCKEGGLGCVGKTGCRYCGFGRFSHISC